MKYFVCARTDSLAGIVQGKAKVATIDKREKFVRLQIEFPQNATNNVNIGASVAINGTCLTARPLVGTGPVRLRFSPRRQILTVCSARRPARTAGDRAGAEHA